MVFNKQLGKMFSRKKQVITPEKIDKKSRIRSAIYQTRQNHTKKNPGTENEKGA